MLGVFAGNKSLKLEKRPLKLIYVDDDFDDRFFFESDVSFEPFKFSGTYHELFSARNNSVTIISLSVVGAPLLSLNNNRDLISRETPTMA